MNNLELAQAYLAQYGCVMTAKLVYQIVVANQLTRSEYIVDRHIVEQDYEALIEIVNDDLDMILGDE